MVIRMIIIKQVEREEKNLKKSVLVEPENYSRQNYICANTRRQIPKISTNQTTHGYQNRLVVFLISGLGYFTFFTDTQSTTKRVEEKNKRTNTDLGQLQAQEGEVCDTFCAFCELTRACTRAKTLTKPLAMLTHLLTDLFCQLVSAAPFCWLSSSVFSWTFLPSFTSSLVGDLVCWPFVWVSCLNKQKDSLIGTHTQRNRCHP